MKASVEHAHPALMLSCEGRSCEGERVRERRLRLRKKATFGIDIPDRSVIYRICPDHPTLKFVGDCLKVA